MKQYTNVFQFSKRDTPSWSWSKPPNDKSNDEKKSPVSLGAEEQARLEQLKTLKFVA